jgi:4-amino-4-deoxy-L-arabinose transferase-like glycosyltransferase
MLAYRIFGVSDWAARLPSAMDATLMVVVIYLFLQRFRPGFQLDGALMTASAAGIIGFARAASTDMPLAATFTVALLAWFAWYESESRRFLALFYCFLALGMLAKGPVAPLLAAVIIVIFAAVTSDYRLLARTLWFPGILLFGAVVLPWHIAVQIKNPEFFRVFILEHNLARFGTNLYHHPEPFWYYLPVTLLGLIPWTVFVLASLAETIRVRWTARRQILDSERALDVFLVIWVAVPVAFFSLSQSKLPGYIVPALPAGILLLAEYVRRRVANSESPSLFLIVLHAITAAAPIVPALMIQYLILQHRLPWGRGAAISFTFAAVLAIGIALTLRTKLGFAALRFITLVPVVLAVAALLRLGAPALDSMLSVRPLANEISHLESKPLPLAVAGVSRETEFGLAFYRNQIIARYESGEVPADEHLVVAPEGSQTAIAKQVAGRRVSYLGSFAPQGLDYYWVSAEGMREMSH